MKSAGEWCVEMFGKSNWVVADQTTIRAIQADAISEAAEIADKHCMASSNFTVVKTSEGIRDAILARVKELEVGK